MVSDEASAFVPEDWTGRDGEQRFSWKLGSVSFDTLGDFADLEVEVRVAEDFDVLPEAVRAVVVPICVSAPGRMVLSDCVNEETIGVPPGEYALLFEIGHQSRKEGEEAEWCRLTFVPRRGTQPRVLRSAG